MPTRIKFLSPIRSSAELIRALISGAPNYMVMFVTARCNARCPMCFYWKETDNANPKLELQLDEYKKISQSLRFLHYLSIGGGEPFIRNDLSEIVEIFYNNSHTRVVTLATNGSFPDRVQSYIKFVSEQCPDIQMRIQVSIDNLHDRHDESRGLKGLFDKVVDTCRVIGDMKKRGAPLVLSIGTVLTPSNRKDLKDLRGFLDKNIAYDDLSLIYPRGNAKVPSLKDVTTAEYNEARKAFECKNVKTVLFSRIYQAIDREARRGIQCYLQEGPKGYPWSCVAGSRMITLTENGALTPCEMLHQINLELDSLIGNVRDYDYNILEMLSTDKAKKLHELIYSTHCACSYECAALCNVVYHKKYWPRILKSIVTT